MILSVPNLPCVWNETKYKECFRGGDGGQLGPGRGLKEGTGTDRKVNHLGEVGMCLYGRSCS